MVIHDIKKIGAGEKQDWSDQKYDEHITFYAIWAFLKRNFIVIIVGCLLGIAGGIAYLSATPAQFRAVARVAMDPGPARIASQDAATGAIIIDSAEIASQVEIVRSEPIARAVIEQFDLVSDPEIQNTVSLRQKLANPFYKTLEFFGLDLTTHIPPSEDFLYRRTKAIFLSRVSVQRIGQSYVLEIGYTSTDPYRAAAIANGIAEAYIKVGVDERSGAARQGAEWLEERLVEIGTKVSQSQLEIERFRAKNEIIPLGTVSSLDQQQLSETSKQLLDAQAATASEIAKLKALSLLMEGAAPPAEIDESLDSTQVQRLREQIRSVEAELIVLQQRYDAGHPAIVSKQGEIDVLRAELRSEYERLGKVLQADLAAARERESLLRAEMNLLKNDSVDSNLARVGLAELESRAATYRRVYENVLQQLIKALQQESFPIGTTRLVSPASVPLSKDSPKTTRILPFFMFLGLAAGLGAAALRETMDRRINTGRNLRYFYDIGTLGELPTRSAGSVLNWFFGKNRAKRPVLRSIIDSPYSDFAESLRAIKSSIQAIHQKKSLVVGITSVRHGEGKTTVAVNLAQLFLNEGMDAIVVDADFETFELTRVTVSEGKTYALEPEAEHEKDAKTGKTENASAVTSPKQPSDLKRPARSGLLPVATTWGHLTESEGGWHYGYLANVKEYIDELSKKYSVVIVDMSSFPTSADARALCTMLDGVVIVMNAARTLLVDQFMESLMLFGKSRINLFGVVLNRSRREDPNFGKRRYP